MYACTLKRNALYGWTVRTIIFFDFPKLSRVINILIVRQLFHPGWSSVLRGIGDNNNNDDRKAKHSPTLPFSPPPSSFSADSPSFFNLFLSFLSSSSSSSPFFFLSQASRLLPARGSQWVTSGCNFNEPVVSGTSHGYHGTDCRQLKLLCQNVVTN